MSRLKILFFALWVLGLFLGLSVFSMYNASHIDHSREEPREEPSADDETGGVSDHGGSEDLAAMSSSSSWGFDDQLDDDLRLDIFAFNWENEDCSALAVKSDRGEDESEVRCFVIVLCSHRILTMLNSFLDCRLR